MLKENLDTNITPTIDNFNKTEHHFTDSTDRVHSTTKKSHVLFQQFSSLFFNEMRDDQAMLGQAGQKIEEWLSQHTLEELKALNQAAKDHFLYEGITFTVYGDEEGTERTIPFDVIPRVMARKQWDTIALGC